MAKIIVEAYPEYKRGTPIGHANSGDTTYDGEYHKYSELPADERSELHKMGGRGLGTDHVLVYSSKNHANSRSNNSQLQILHKHMSDHHGYEHVQTLNIGSRPYIKRKVFVYKKKS